jgi:hypothetical protein
VVRRQRTQRNRNLLHAPDPLLMVLVHVGHTAPINLNLIHAPKQLLSVEFVARGL